MELSDRIWAWIKEQVEKAGARGCVFGLSGGLDSSVVGALCKKAFPDTALGLLIPCYSSPQDLEHARMVADKFKIPARLVDLSSTLSALYLQLEGRSYNAKKHNLAAANLKPRLRMTALYYHANKNNYLVVGTGNKSEAVMGYSTKYGDAGVDLLPLGGMLKREVRALAEKLGIPEEIIKKPPSAGLWLGQTDEDEMGISYAELDAIISALEKGDTTGLDEKLIEKVKQRKEAGAHKFSPPPVFE